MKIYIYQRHQFWTPENGIERHVSNEGRTPFVFTSKKRAEEFFMDKMKEDGINSMEAKLLPYMHYEKKYNINDTKMRDVVTLIESETF